MTEKTPPPIDVTSIKAADPGVSFQVINSKGGILENLAIMVRLIKMTSPLVDFQTQVSLSNPTSDVNMGILVPFGDDAYQPGELLQFEINISFVWSGNGTPALVTVPPVRGLVLTTAGQMTVGSNMTKVVKQGMPLFSLPSNQVFVSMDDQYIGVLSVKGRFEVYPQSQIGDNLSMLVPVYDSGLENDAWTGCSLIFGKDGYVKIESSPSSYFISQQMPSGTTGLAIVSNNGSSFPFAALCFVNDAGAPLGTVEFSQSQQPKEVNY